MKKKNELKRTPKGGCLEKGQNASFAYYDVEPNKEQKVFQKLDDNTLQEEHNKLIRHELMLFGAPFIPEEAKEAPKPAK